MAIVLGTRPEGIKCAPIIRALRERETEFAVTVISTGQHTDMLQQALRPFAIIPDVNMGLMQTRSDLAALVGKAIQSLADFIRTRNPHMLLVQGDTSTALAGALTAFCQGIPVGHVEAGLRSRDLHDPFPEEANRCAISLFANLHFAPTANARAALLEEHIPAKNIVLTGNTVVDSLKYLVQHGLRPVDEIVCSPLGNRRLILVTAHRREAWGEGLENICRAVQTLARRYPDVLIVFPVHKNPVVRDEVHAMLQQEPRVCLLDSLDYFDFVSLLHKAVLVLTDSGGIQEEAPTFRVPVLVLRNVTERMEAVQAGLARVVGVESEVIVQEASRLLDNPEARDAMRTGENPFGDGQASLRIVEALHNWQLGREPLLSPERSFAGGF